MFERQETQFDLITESCESAKACQLESSAMAAGVPEFFRQFAVMINAGLPVIRCLEVLSEQFGGRLSRVALRMRESVSSGSTLTEAAQEHRGVFSPLAVNLIRAAEMSGHLDLVLQRLADSQENLSRMKRQFISKMIYPAILLHAGAVIPSVVTWFNKGSEAALIEVGKVLVPVYLVIIACFLIYKFSKIVPPARFFFDAVFYHVPIIGGTIRKVGVARFASTFEAMNSAGISVLEAVPMSAEATGNAVMEWKIKRAVPRLHDGEDLAIALAGKRAFSPMVNGMIATGAERGKLDVMLAKVSEHAELDARTSIDRMGTIVPGLIYALIAIYAGMTIIRMMSGYVDMLKI